MLKLLTLPVCSVILASTLTVMMPVAPASRTEKTRQIIPYDSQHEHKVSRQQLVELPDSNTLSVAQQRDLEVVWQEIKSLAKREAASNSPSFIHSDFRVQIIGSTPQIRITKGDVSDLGFGDDPYGVTFRKQILIESIRLALERAHLESVVPSTGPAKSQPSSPAGSSNPQNEAATSNGNAQWQCYLDQAEQLVRQTVIAIETITDKNQLKQLLQKTEDQVDELLYNKLFESIERYAVEHRYNVIYDRGGETVKPFSVAIVTVPEGAKVWVMTDLVYRKQLMLKADRSQWPWKELVQNPADLIGTYQYMATWPDGKRAEGNIDVTSASPLTFKPQ